MAEIYDVALSAASHDLLITNGDLLVIGNAERVAQMIKVTLLAWKGEWFLDQRFGVPYLESVLVKNPNMAHIRGILRAKIQEVPGVNRVISLSTALNVRERTLSVSYEASTEYGLVKGKEVLGYGD